MDKLVEKRMAELRRKYATQIGAHTIVFGQKLDKLQEGNFDYDEPQRPDNETLGHYAEQLREKLGVE